MPELPEVEVTRLGLLPWLPDRTITRIRWSGKQLRLPLPRTRLEKHILGNRVATIDRRAKYLFLRMTDSSVLVIHLGMTGRLGLFEKSSSLDRHDHLRLLLDSGRELRFNDPRRFGTVLVWPASEQGGLEAAFCRNLGIEPLGNDFTPRALQELAIRRRTAVKSFLMNGRLIAGIGNIYANEILHGARIHPAMPVHNLSPCHWQEIVSRTRTILLQAIEAGGSTISDFLGASGQPGYFQLQLAVYGRGGRPCRRCNRTIETMRLAGRTTFFCPHCQPAEPSWLASRPATR